MDFKPLEGFEGNGRKQRRDVCLAIFLAQYDIAGQCQCDIDVVLQCLVCELWIACSEDLVWRMLDIEFLLQRRLNIDFCDDAEMFLLKRGPHMRFHLGKSEWKGSREAVVSGGSHKKEGGN